MNGLEGMLGMRVYYCSAASDRTPSVWTCSSPSATCRARCAGPREKSTATAVSTTSADPLPSNKLKTCQLAIANDKTIRMEGFVSRNFDISSFFYHIAAKS